MSHLALQRVIVRLLHDPALVAALHADPAAALAGEALTPAEVTALRAIDRRAFGADTERRRRALQPLLEEFPVSAALALRAGGGLPALEAFFSDARFHACIAARGSLALSFADFLGAGAAAPGGDPRVAETARVEAAIARVRRAPTPTPNPTPNPNPNPAAAPAPATAAALPERLACAARVEPLTVAGGTLALVQAVLERLDAAPDGRLAAIVAAVGLADLPPLAAAEPEHLLVEGAADPTLDAQVLPVSDALVDLLGRARPAAPRADLLAAARHHGAAPGEDEEILAELVAEGWLVPA